MRRRWFVLIVAFVVVLIGLSFVFDQFPEKQKELRTNFRNSVAEQFPEQAAQQAESYGLILWQPDGSEGASREPAAPNIVLVHGLDDPGLVWRSLAPVLWEQGMNVWVMTYPNDQPIVDSAGLFLDELAHLRTLGFNQVSIVSHSMGGLVSREMLTNPDMDFEHQSGSRILPEVNALVMVGTPNHGSEWARFRIFGELRDQWINLWQNNGSLLRGYLDGAGEARIDLLPGSAFLQQLNARAHPEGIRMLIIAGVVSPWDEQRAKEFLERNQENEMAAALKSFADSMRNGLGDGVVTVDSTRLEGVEHRTVPGTHLTMIRNLSAGEQQLPPAVPIIVDFLSSDTLLGNRP